ncbi:MAG: efflux RND transporter periplasmic adaptor subunit [Oscillospiraceae bacterium]|nr:efflux RND transporter periplasmic adaptor subunit [Oscillospiraceae bacterium]
MKKFCAIVLCAACVLSLAGCGSEVVEEQMDSTITVETAKAAVGSLQTSTSYVGTVTSDDTVSVVTLVSGNVEEVNVSVGDTVEVDQQLCRVDDESAQLSLSSANASLNSARESYSSAVANYGGSELTLLQQALSLAQDNYDTTAALYEIGAASKVEVDSAQQSLTSAQAAVDAAQATLSSAQAGIQAAQVGVDSAQYQLSLYNITSPISGTVEAVNVTENNFVGSGSVAFIISTGDNREVSFYVTDEVRRNIEVGQSVSISNAGIDYSGYVAELSNVVDSTTGMFKVKAMIYGAESLPDGLSVTLTTVSHNVEDMIIIPADALYYENGEAFVYIMSDGAAVRTYVEIDSYTTEEVAVSSGLAEGDEVIVTGSSNLRDGAAVRLASDAETE